MMDYDLGAWAKSYPQHPVSHSSFWSESFITAIDRQIGADIGTSSGVGGVMNPIVSAFIALELFPFVDDFGILSW